MEKLYVVYANGELMRKGKAMLGSDNEAVVKGWKDALEVSADILGNHDTFYEVVPYVIDYPTKNYAEQGVEVSKPKPEDFTAGISNDAYMYACKSLGMNPMDVNTVRTSEQWAEIVELAKKHDVGVPERLKGDVYARRGENGEIHNPPNNLCEYISRPDLHAGEPVTPEGRPWSTSVQFSEGCDLTPVPGIKPQLSEHTEDEVEEMLNENLKNKIERTASKVLTKEVHGIYSMDDEHKMSEFHRDGQHVLFSTYELANNYVNRIANFVEFGVFSRKKMVPITTKVIGDGLK